MCTIRFIMLISAEYCLCNYEVIRLLIYSVRIAEHAYVVLLDTKNHRNPCGKIWKCIPQTSPALRILQGLDSTARNFVFSTNVLHLEWPQGFRC